MGGSARDCSVQGHGACIAFQIAGRVPQLLCLHFCTSASAAICLAGTVVRIARCLGNAESRETSDHGAFFLPKRKKIGTWQMLALGDALGGHRAVTPAARSWCAGRKLTGPAASCCRLSSLISHPVSTFLLSAPKAES